MSLRRRLERLEARTASKGWELDPEDLRAMSREELKGLEERVEEEVARGERSFWDLYTVGVVKRQRVTEIFAAMKSVRADERETRTAEEHRAACEEVRHKTSNVKNGYRIWRYYRGEKMPEDLRKKLYEGSEAKGA